MPRSVVTNLALALALVIGASYASPLANGRSGAKVSNALSQDDYDYTYGDLVYDYDMALQSSPQKRTERVDATQERRVFKQEAKEEQHEVLDDALNYDYTYGDPEYSYEHYDEMTPRREKKGVAGPSDHEGSADDEDVATKSEDKDKTVIGPIVTSFIVWVIRNWKDVKHVRDTWAETKDHLNESWGKVKHSLARISKALGGVLVKFGKEAEEGLKYCLVRLKSTSEKISEQGLEAIDKLERLLEEGNEMAASFFRLIGIKLGEIAGEYSQGPIFTQDLQLSNYFVFEGMQNEESRATIPNLFEDKDVLGKLKLMVQLNILKAEEVEALLTAAAQQSQRATGKKYPEKIRLYNNTEDIQEEGRKKNIMKGKPK
ncbi:uncharacterized protein [Palaemon carinicauda]|uniref:uncharacterized protein n=1 Tax=Palaemon carinicauda TaxID=392227 RepID=UPI0035B5D1E9